MTNDDNNEDTVASEHTSDEEVNSVDQQQDEELEREDESEDDLEDKESSEEDQDDEDRSEDGQEDKERSEDDPDDKEGSEDDSDDEEESEDSNNTGHRGQLRFNTNSSNTHTTPSRIQSPITYRQRRLALTIKIQEVESNPDCLYKIAAEVNEFLKFAKKKNKHFRLRRFDDTSTPDAKDRTKWLTKVSNSSASDFMAYIYGYFPSANPRGGMFRLRLNTVMDATDPLPRLLKDLAHDWGHTDSRFIADLKAQTIWDPIKIGYLMRAPRYLTHSYEFVEAIESSPQAKKHKIHFGISWSTIPSPVGGYDRETAVQAVMIETNKADLYKAVSF